MPNAATTRKTIPRTSDARKAPLGKRAEDVVAIAEGKGLLAGGREARLRRGQDHQRRIKITLEVLR